MKKANKRKMKEVEQGVATTESELAIQYVRLDELERWPRNPKEHDEPLISGLIERFGFINPIIKDETSGRMVAGHGRLETLFHKMDSGEDPPKRIKVDNDGMWCAPVLMGVSFNTEQEAEAYVIGDNQSTIAGGWDDVALLSIMNDFTSQGLEDLAELSGFSEDDISVLSESIDISVLEARSEKERTAIKGARPKDDRKLPLDAIFTVKGRGAYCCIAVKAGLKYGTQSDAPWICPNVHERGHRICFIDNEWKGYNHDKHRMFVAKYRPKYATVIDAMTKNQCKEAGITYYPLPQILEWAEDLQEYCDNVIVIPKYDCVDQIPGKFMLGYSVPSSYGGTPLPLEAFRGRRVHLLGGSWANQLEGLSLLGDDCRSLDFNMVYKAATHGRFIKPDGSIGILAKTIDFTLTNPVYVCITLSFGAIAGAIKGIAGLDRDVLDLLKEDEVPTYIADRIEEERNS